MDADPKIEACPMPGCGARCESCEGRVYCVDCDYCTRGYATDANAADVHNALCRKVALHGELVALMRDLAVEDQERDGEWLGADVADRVNALLTRARGETEVGS